MSRLFSFLVLTLSSLCLPTAVAVSAQTTSEVTTAERSTNAFSQLICQRLDSLVQLPLMQRSQLGLCVYDLTTDSMLYAHGHQQRMRPASSMKVITAVTALDKLGGDYQFSTQLYSTVAPTDSVLQGSLVARGGFDPLFGRDDLRAFVEVLRQRGIRRITGDLVLDVSMKDTTSFGWGWCWDDKNKPLTPLLYRGNDSWADHFYEHLGRAGITLEGNIQRGTLPRGAQLLVERKHSIDQVLHPMLKDSNNLCAEAMFYQLAALSKRAYATYKDAAAQVQRVIAQCGLQPSDYLVADGSGLSLYNYVSPELLVAMLRHAARSEETFTHLTTALSLAQAGGAGQDAAVGEVDEPLDLDLQAGPVERGLGEVVDQRGGDGAVAAVQGAQGDGGGDCGEIDHAAHCGRLAPISASGASWVETRTGWASGRRRR